MSFICGVLLLVLHIQHCAARNATSPGGVCTHNALRAFATLSELANASLAACLAEETQLPKDDVTGCAVLSHLLNQEFGEDVLVLPLPLLLAEIPFKWSFKTRRERNSSTLRLVSALPSSQFPSIQAVQHTIDRYIAHASECAGTRVVVLTRAVGGFEPNEIPYIGLWQNSTNPAPSTVSKLLITTEIRPLVKRGGRWAGAYLKVSRGGAYSQMRLTNSIDELVPLATLDNFIVVPGFTSHTCHSVQPTIKLLRARRKHRVCFVGCIYTHRQYRNYPSPGFEARKTFLSHVNSTGALVINTCTGNHGRGLVHAARRIYANCDVCLATGGDSVTSVRIFDASAMLCIPLFTDNALVLPFGTAFPWERVSFLHPIVTQGDADAAFHRAELLSQKTIVSMRGTLAQHLPTLLWQWHADEGESPDPSCRNQQAPSTTSVLKERLRVAVAAKQRGSQHDPWDGMSCPSS